MNDKGIFDVSLKNEYEYMALILEKAKNKNGEHLYSRGDTSMLNIFLTAKEVENNINNKVNMK